MTEEKNGEDPGLTGDAAVEVTRHTTDRLSDAYRPYDRHHFSLSGPDGTIRSFDREVLGAGKVVGVLTLDLARRELVLIRQFRIAAHLATGRGELVEIVAGRVDGGESSRDAAMRECEEEIGVAPIRLARVMTFLPAAAFADELMTLWIAEVDSSRVPDFTGLEDEGEFIRPFRVPIRRALDGLGNDVWRSAPLVIALQWLQANATRLEAVLRGDGANDRA